VQNSPGDAPNADTRIVTSRDETETVRGELKDVDPSVVSVKGVEEKSGGELVEIEKERGQLEMQAKEGRSRGEVEVEETKLTSQR